MILINPNVTDLAAGYAVIEAFVSNLETTWLPGFERSYKRRMAEYQKALEKHEERGFFLRTLLKSPKQPNRPPLRYRQETAARMLSAWQASFAISAPISTVYTPLYESVGDYFYALADHQLQADLAASLLVLGPAGIFVIADHDSLEERQQTAVVIGTLLEESGHIDPPISTISIREGSPALAELKSTRAFTEQTVMEISDKLLTRRQEMAGSRTFSALATAEKIADREKDNLLRMAATL